MVTTNGTGTGKGSLPPAMGVQVPMLSFSLDLELKAWTWSYVQEKKGRYILGEATGINQRQDHPLSRIMVHGRTYF